MRHDPNYYMHIEEEDLDTDWKIAIIESVGFIIKETDAFIVLAGDVLEKSCQRVIVIPKENIISTT